MKTFLMLFNDFLAVAVLLALVFWALMGRRSRRLLHYGLMAAIIWFLSSLVLLAGDKVWYVPLFTNRVITSSSTNYSVALTMNAYQFTHSSLGVELDASGLSNGANVTLNYQMSNDGTNYLSHTNAIASAFSNQSGRAAGGRELYSISPVPSRYLRFQLISGASSSGRVSSALTGQ